MSLLEQKKIKRVEKERKIFILTNKGKEKKK